MAVLPPVPAFRRQDDDVQDGRTKARAARALDHHVLRTVFMDVVGRPPFQAEYTEWLDQGLAALLDHLLGGEEYWRHWWEEQLYYFLLIDNFRPETSTAREVPTKLAEGRLHVRDALHRVALTPTFDLRNPGADTFVTVVMEQMCGIVVQNQTRELEIGKRVYDGGKGRFLGRTSESQADVIEVAVNHKKAAKHLVLREFGRFTRRAPDKGNLARWTALLHRDPYRYLELSREWLLSPEYSQRLGDPVSKSNRLFVRGLFVDLLGRLPTQDEVEPMRNALDGLADSRPLRSVLVRLMLDSGQAAVPAKASLEESSKWIAERFRRLLGREATEEELSTFVSVIRDAECRTETILYALLSHTEYHSY